MPSSRVLPTLLAALTAATASPAQPPAPPADRPWPLAALHDPYRQARPEAPLVALLELRDNQQRALDEGKWLRMFFDLESTAATFAGDYALALEAESLHFRHAEPRVKGTVDLSGYHAAPALAAVLDASKDRRVVMLNEEHRVHLQRAFLAESIAGFRRLGFTHLAMETLGEDPAALAARGHAVLGTGFYTKDPILAEAVRRALSLGMSPVRYEPEPAVIGPAPGDRDRLSGEKLASFLRDNPGARLLVYAGRYHIAEAGDAEWKPMAAVLRDRAGIDPLTVDLSAMRECHRREDEHPAYRAADAAGLIGPEPVVLLNEAGAFYTHMPGQVDLQVFFPRTVFEHGRPGCLALHGERTPLDLAPHLPAIKEPVLARADRAGEGPNSVAADQTVIWPDRPPPALLLAPGDYSIRILTRAGRMLYEFKHHVP